MTTTTLAKRLKALGSCGDARAAFSKAKRMARERRYMWCADWDARRARGEQQRTSTHVVEHGGAS